MSLSREDKIAIVADMLQNHQTLSPKLFDDRLMLRPEIHAHLLRIFEVYKKHVMSFYPLAELKDLILVGSICSYTYSQSSDFDLMAVLDNITGDSTISSKQILAPINYNILKFAWKPTIFGHDVDMGFIDTDNFRIGGINDYSVLHNKWNSQPIRQEYPFTAEELFAEYCRYSADLHKYVKSLEKIDDTFLTPQSCRKLKQYLFDLRIAAFEAKNHSPQREYSLEYNLFRLLKRFGAYTHFHSYIDDSFKHIMGRPQ